MSIFVKNTRIYISIIICETLYIYETYKFSIQYLKSNRTLYIDYTFSEEVITSYLDRNSIKNRAEVQNACQDLMYFNGILRPVISLTGWRTRHGSSFFCPWMSISGKVT